MEWPVINIKHKTLNMLLGLSIGMALLNAWFVPTQDGLTIGLGQYGYHISYEELEGENHE